MSGGAAAQLEPYQWQPGQSGNPGGKPHNLLSVPGVHKLFSRIAAMTRSELQALIVDPKSNMMELSIAAIFAKAAKDGDYTRVEFILQRTIGRVKDTQEFKLINEKAMITLDSEPREHVMALLRAMHGPKAPTSDVMK